MASIGAVRSRPSIVSYLLGGLALVALAAMSIFVFAAGLMAPLWAVIAFRRPSGRCLFIRGCVWIRRHPLRVSTLPAIAAAVWFGGMTAGEQLAGMDRVTPQGATSFGRLDGRVMVVEAVEFTL